MSAVSESARYYGNNAVFPFVRSRLRSFVPGKANEVFYAPFDISSDDDRANAALGVREFRTKRTYARPLGHSTTKRFVDKTKRRDREITGRVNSH